MTIDCDSCQEKTGKRRRTECLSCLNSQLYEAEAEIERLKSQKLQAQQAISNFHGTVGDLNDAILTIMEIDEVLSDFRAVTRRGARVEENND